MGSDFRARLARLAKQIPAPCRHRPRIVVRPVDPSAPTPAGATEAECRELGLLWIPDHDDRPEPPSPGPAE